MTTFAKKIAKAKCEVADAEAEFRAASHRLQEARFYLRHLRCRQMRDESDVPSVLSIFLRIGAPFADGIASEPYYEIRGPCIFRDAVDMTWTVVFSGGRAWLSPGSRFLSLEKLRALWIIDRWLKRRRDATLAFLYRPDGALAQAFIARAMAVSSFQPALSN